MRARGSPTSSIRSSNQKIDEAVVTYFARPHSYTGEDLVEIAAHGSPVVLEMLVRLALRAGARLARPGEFTERAFLAGRIDLTQAEAVRDLIEAQTLYQARIAAEQMGGALSRRIQPGKQSLVELIALLEAGIDFAEDDVEVTPDEEIVTRIDTISAELQALARSFEHGRLVHAGLRLAIVGRPNVGKSSLFNRLLERERAIVTAQPGTTRDLVTDRLSLGGIPVELVDTAGLREAKNEAEAIGIRKSREMLADADIVMVVLDASVPLRGDERELIASLEGRRALVVRNKSDLNDGAEVPPDLPLPSVATSALTGDGVQTLARCAGGIRAQSCRRNRIRHSHQPAPLRSGQRSAGVARRGARRRRPENPPRDAAARPLRRPAPSRQPHRRNHRGRYPESDLLHLLHRKVASVTMKQVLCPKAMLAAVLSLVAFATCTPGVLCQNMNHDGKQKVILDTDIGDDIDDAFALALAVSSPKLQVIGVTTAWGDTDLRARLTQRFLKVSGHGDIPVAAGPKTRASSTFSQARWAQVEPMPAKGFPDATDFTLNAIRRNPGQITLIAIAPFSNIGALIDRDPATFNQLKRIVLMGGSIQRRYGDLGYLPDRGPEPEYNIMMDIASSKKLFASGVPIEMMPLDSTQLKFDEMMRDTVFSQATPMTDALLSLYEEWSASTGNSDADAFRRYGGG